MKKFLSLLLVSAMTTACLVGCGEKEESKSENPAATEDVAEAKFVIGGIGPITGGAAIYGQCVKNSTEIAVEEINAAGGINGYQVEFVWGDDEHDAEKSVNAYNSLKDQGMQILLGTVTSTPCVAVADEAAKDNMFLLTPSGSAVDCTVNDNAFRVCFSDPNQGKASAQYIGDNGLATKVAVIYDSSDVYSSGIYETFANESKEQPFEIVVAEAFTADNKTDFSVQVQKAKDAGADLVFLPIYYQEAALILNEAEKQAYAPTFFGCDGIDGLLSVEGFDSALAEDVMLLTPFVADEDKELTKNFVTTYEEKFGGIPNQFGADAYDGMYAIKAAIEKAGLTPDMSVSDLCEGLKTAMTEISIDGLTGEGITWTADGEPSKSPKAMIIKDGSYTAM